MKIIKEIKDLRDEIKKIRLKNKSVGFVPTMGALHAGHLSLIRQAGRENGCVVVSIFVNPLQFGPKEDLKRYPRDLKKDASLCRKASVDIVFYPDAKKLYPPDYKTYVSVRGLSSRLCGKARPGHFEGVATVVAKLFNIVNPDTAYFGQKDAQQAIIIKKMVSDLNMPVRIKVMPTVREKDGLALSSRNAYLSGKQRQDALILYRCLNKALGLIKSGKGQPYKIVLAMRGLIRQIKTAKIDYIAIVDSHDLRPVEKISNNCLIALAVWIGRTRLIDNIIVRGIL